MGSPFEVRTVSLDGCTTTTFFNIESDAQRYFENVDWAFYNTTSFHNNTNDVVVKVCPSQTIEVRMKGKLVGLVEEVHNSESLNTEHFLAFNLPDEDADKKHTDTRFFGVDAFTGVGTVRWLAILWILENNWGKDD